MNFPELYHVILTLHSYLRWGIMALLLILLILCFLAYRRCKRSAELDITQGKAAIRRFSSLLVIFVDLSVVLGIFLFIAYIRFKVVGQSIMQNPEIRKRLVEHAPIMLIFLVLVHLASITLRKTNMEERRRCRNILIYYAISIVLLLMSIPSWSWRNL